MNLAQIAKFCTAVAGVCAQILAANVLTGPEQHYVQVALAVATALGVYLVPNAPAT